MARPLRIEYPGAVYHITSRGNEKKSIFKDDQERYTFLDILETVNKRYHWMCHAYCLMDNHYHLLIETPDGNLFQGRYKDILIQKDSHLLAVCRYVVLNPVRRGIVARPAAWK